MKNEYLEFHETTSPCQSFHALNDPEIIHVIKTGFTDRYMVVYEDAYELNLGKVIFGTKFEIKINYVIYSNRC